MTSRNSGIFDILRKLKIALDVDRDVIDGDFVRGEGAHRHRYRDGIKRSFGTPVFWLRTDPDGRRRERFFWAGISWEGEAPLSPGAPGYTHRLNSSKGASPSQRPASNKNSLFSRSNIVHGVARWLSRTKKMSQSPICERLLIRLAGEFAKFRYIRSPTDGRLMRTQPATQFERSLGPVFDVPVDRFET